MLHRHVTGRCGRDFGWGFHATPCFYDIGIGLPVITSPLVAFLLALHHLEGLLLPKLNSMQNESSEPDLLLHRRIRKVASEPGA